MKKVKYLLLSIFFITTFNYGQTFTLKSNDIGGQAIMKQVNKYCGGENISPQLFWEHAPDSTKSFAVTIHDKDAPTGSGWWHWLVFDIPASVNELVASAGNIDTTLAPKGSIQSITSFGKAGYGGPCPPKGHGFHQYLITVYALNTDKLGLDKNATPAKVGFYLNHSTIQKASMVMYFKM
ncbi:MAG: YbhB/YbcL family Raf kinase inhibitor-like protein [Melioribacteraceae bacterium]